MYPNTAEKTFSLIGTNTASEEHITIRTNFNADLGVYHDPNTGEYYNAAWDNFDQCWYLSD